MREAGEAAHERSRVFLRGEERNTVPAGLHASRSGPRDGRMRRAADLSGGLTLAPAQCEAQQRAGSLRDVYVNHSVAFHISAASLAIAQSDGFVAHWRARPNGFSAFHRCARRRRTAQPPRSRFSDPAGTLGNEPRKELCRVLRPELVSHLA